MVLTLRFDVAGQVVLMVLTLRLGGAGLLILFLSDPTARIELAFEAGRG